MIDKGCQIFFSSSTGENIGILSDATENGAFINPIISHELFGGVKFFSFSISKDCPITMSKGMRCAFYSGGVSFGSGYIDTIPNKLSDDGLLEISGLGLSNKLKGIKISEEYSDKTIDFIFKDILNTYLSYEISILYDVLKIATMPTITGISINFENVTLYDAIMACVNIINYDYENQKFRFFIDDDSFFNLAEIDENIQRNIFEGYDFQNPESELDTSKIVNKILLYRANQADSKIIEYVSTVEDADSQSRNNVREKKIVFPSNLNTETIEKIGASYLGRYGDEKKIVGIESMIVLTPLEFSYYVITGRKSLGWDSICSCDSLGGWNVSGFSSANLSVSNEHVLTGMRSLKITTNESSGEYIDFIPDKNIGFFPLKFRTFLYFELSQLNISIIFYDSVGNTATIELSNKNIQLETSDGNMTVDIVSSDYEVKYKLTEDGKYKLTEDGLNKIVITEV